MEHHPVFMPPDIAVHSGDHLNKDLEKLLGKSVPPSDYGTAPKADGPQRPAADGYGTNPGPIFADLISAGAIVDGGAATPGVAERFNENLATMIGATSGNRNFYGKRAKSGAEDAAHMKSRSASASQDNDDNDLERFAGALGHELHKRGIGFGKGDFRPGAEVVTRDGVHGVVLEKSTDSQRIHLKTRTGEMYVTRDHVLQVR